MKQALVFFAFIVTFQLTAQKKCAFDELQPSIERAESEEQFEYWLDQKIHQKRKQRTTSVQDQEVYTIPVVIHVIHDGSEIGDGSNISDRRILEQIEILNQDYSRTNEDATETLTVFQDVAANTGIQFVLAKQDPEGMPTDGIVRVEGSNPSFGVDLSELSLIASHSNWPPQDYFNIYVTDLRGDYIGYAQFPFSNIDGIATEIRNYAEMDGAYIDYKFFGFNSNTGGFDSYGRTATHEIGHFLGLKHPWGNCSTDDFCDDTPFASSSSNGCDLEKETCGSLDMVQNYLDYTDDECMNLFTQCQTTRMRTILEESPRRHSLLSSHALLEPNLVTNDLGIRSIISPTQSQCNSSVSPGVQVRNYGEEKITSFEIVFYINNELKQSKSVTSSLATGETMEVTFDPLTITPEITNEISFEIVTVNGNFDLNSANNIKTELIAPFKTQIPPYSVYFSDENDLFYSTENNTVSQWELVSAPDSTVDNKSLMLPFYDNMLNFGYRDIVQTQTIDLSSLTSAQLDFSYAYASREISSGEYYQDGLVVIVSTDCGATFPRENIVFERYGRSLRTTSNSADSFAPTRSSNWTRISRNITRFAGLENIQVAFAGVNGSGNNIYLDNIEVTSANLQALDIGIKDVVNLPVVTCTETVRPRVEIKNYGYQDIESLELELTHDGVTSTELFEELDLRSGESETLYLNDNFNLQQGNNSFHFQITTINGQTDDQIENNEFDYVTRLSSETDIIPVQEKFDDLNWEIAHPDGFTFLEVVEVEGNSMLSSTSFDNIETGSSFLVSPILETGAYEQAAIRFNYSYAQRQNFNDNLKVWLSIDCGRTYSEELLSLSAEQMSVASSGVMWVPESSNDWRQAFIDITEFINWPEIRVAIELINGGGNNIYIDDINVLTTNNPGLPEFPKPATVYPNPATGSFNLAFNFKDKQSVRVRVISLSGEVVFDENFGNLINQTFSFNAPSQKGIYIVMVDGDGFNYTEKLFIKQ